MRVRKRETYWRVQTFEMGKTAALDESINGRLFLVNTVQGKLLCDPEEEGGGGGSAVIYRTLMKGLRVTCK